MIGAKRFWVYPAKIKGTFQKLHRISGTILLGILIAVPWIRIAGQPLLMFDIPARRFFLAGMVFTPRDSLLLFLFLITAAFTLFFFTAMYGRLWCGFACPQTVLLEELIRRIEYAIEGDRGPRRKRDEGPWTAEKVRKKSLKWTIFAALAILLGFSFLGFFESSYEIWSLQASTGAYVVGGAFAFILFLDFAWFREQFCIYLCPYARLQGAMTDEHSLIIGYESGRGEPRLDIEAIKAQEASKADFGDCVNCDRCVAVCPTGIDIREGFQLECISCARCIDACTEVLGRQNKPTLIRFASENEIEGRETKKFRPRTFVYGAINTIAAVAALVFVFQRPDFDLTIAPVRGGDSEVTLTGKAQNRYEFTVFNNTMEEKTFRFDLEGLSGASLIVPGETITLPPAERRRVQAFVIASPDEVAEGNVHSFTVIARSDEHTIRRDATFRFFGGNPHASMANPRLYLAWNGVRSEHAARISGSNAQRSRGTQL